MITCAKLRHTVEASALLSLAGLLLLLTIEITGLMLPAVYAALLLVLAGVAVLGVAFITAVLPGSAKRLRECWH